MHARSFERISSSAFAVYFPRLRRRSRDSPLITTTSGNLTEQRYAIFSSPPLSARVQKRFRRAPCYAPLELSRERASRGKFISATPKARRRGARGRNFVRRDSFLLARSARAAEGKKEYRGWKNLREFLVIPNLLSHREAFFSPLAFARRRSFFCNYKHSITDGGKFDMIGEGRGRGNFARTIGFAILKRITGKFRVIVR